MINKKTKAGNVTKNVIKNLKEGVESKENKVVKSRIKIKTTKIKGGF
ncbi:MAG TPA: hypothetical protein GX516_04685 [Thermoanaerobacter sp.]|nr:hypothetical protein [Thermoanaerobacter sp.]